MFPGRTYTLSDDNGSSRAYFEVVGSLVDEMLTEVPEPRNLLKTVRKGSGPWRFFQRFTTGAKLHRRFLEKMELSLSPFTGPIEEHLGSLSLAGRLDPILRTPRFAYLSYMVEIQLVNRVNAMAFADAPWRMALVAHCLRDFRPRCKAEPGEVEEVCARCEKGCYVGSGARILEKYRVETFISVSMDHPKLFTRLKGEHPEMGVLGIACIPELVMGMRLCDGMGIPAVGVPLDANRCTRWMDECLETTYYSLEQLEKLLKGKI
ncbi:MAG: DUF116 domain-containing protein [bacterium]|nr:DUF116 domain-containing protein [bacterium]